VVERNRENTMSAGDPSPEFHATRTNLSVVWFQVIVWLGIGGVIVWTVASSYTRFEDALARLAASDKEIQKLKASVETELQKAKQERDKFKGDVSSIDVRDRVSALENQAKEERAFVRQYLPPKDPEVTLMQLTETEKKIQNVLETKVKEVRRELVSKAVFDVVKGDVDTLKNTPPPKQPDKAPEIVWQIQKRPLAGPPAEFNFNRQVVDAIAFITFFDLKGPEMPIEHLTVGIIPGGEKRKANVEIVGEKTVRVHYKAFLARGENDFRGKMPFPPPSTPFKIGGVDIVVLARVR
jgi:hypothetical protein